MRRVAVFVFLLTLAVSLGAGVASQRAGGTTSPPGTIVVDGSSTVAPLTSAVAEEFPLAPQDGVNQLQHGPLGAA